MDLPTPIFPPRLREGDAVAVLSPSSAGPWRFVRAYELGLRNLERVLGVRVKEYPTARLAPEELYADPRRRAEDVNAAFADPEVRAIVASLGGEESVRILPHLDVPAILASPKLLMGFSDVTTLTAYLAQKGLVTLNGPTVIAGFAQMRHLPEAFGTHVRDLLMSAAVPPPYQPYESWCDGYSDWLAPDYDGETKPLRAADGWRWLQGEGVATGRLFGGCAEVLEFMKATPFWPAPEFWEGRVLFLETSEVKPSPRQVSWMLRNYGSMGALERISALLVGRPRDYSDEEKEELCRVLVRGAAEFGRPDLPIVANLDFGHTDPQWIVPLNVRMEVDCERRTLRLLEAPVS